MNFKLVKFSIIFVIVSTIINCSLGDNILFMQTCSTYSHRIAHWPIVEQLIEKGHNITFLSPFDDVVKENVRHHKVFEIVPKSLKDLVIELTGQHFDVNIRAMGLVPPHVLVLDAFCYMGCKSAISSPEMKNWVESQEKVDLVIGDFVSECSLGVAHKFGAKHILYTPIQLNAKYFESYGINSESSSIPDYDLSSKPPLSFYHRLKYALFPLWYRVLDIIFHNFFYHPLFQKHLGISSEEEIKRNTDLLILNGDFISDYPRSWPPFVVKVEGIHIKKDGVKALPKVIESFISGNDKTEGLVYISFGTLVKARSLPLDLRQVFFKFIETFGNLQFIWKWEGEKPQEYPKNLLLVDWIDQMSLLAHPKIKAFLTQAGRPSTQEALYMKVPMITFPVLGDQDFNADRLSGLGLSVPLDFVGLTTEKLVSALNEIMQNEDYYKENLNRISTLTKDVMNDPVKTATWWVEFVLRHSKEDLDLLKPLAQNLYWFQKRDLDVWAFLLLLQFCILYSVYKIVKYMYERRKTENNAKKIQLNLKKEK